MPGHLLRGRLLVLASVLCVASCLSTTGYYRYDDGGLTGAAGAAGTVGPGTAGTGGSAAGTGGGTAGTVATAGRGGATGAAGAAAGRGGTTGTAGSAGGRGGTAATAGTTGTAGATGTAGGNGAVLFMDDFESGTTKWDISLNATSMVTTDGSHVLNLSETAGDQAVAAAGMPNWTNISIEARVKVLNFTGTSTSDVVAICVRLSGLTSFYYFAIQSDGKGKIKIQNSGNSSIGSSFDFGYTVNTWYTMKFTVVGSSLTAYVNGAMVGAMQTDANLTVGGVGLMVQRASAEFDDVVVRSAP